MPERKLISGVALTQEQIETQTGVKGKCRVRSFDEYSSYLCSHRIIEETRDGLHTARLCREFNVKPIPSTVPCAWDGSKRQIKLVPQGTNWLSQIIKRLEKENPNQTLRWTDLGCGHRIAQREHQLKHPNSRTLTQGIDLIPPTWQEVECQIPELKKASTRRHYRKLGKVPETTVQGDVSTMEFGPSHLITAIEVIQYIEDKLAALCHWYNQLAPGGVMVIATETSWTSWIRIKSERYGENSIIDQFLTKVNHLAQHMSREEPDDISTLIIFKAANHQLISKAKPHHIWINPHGYKATYYHKRREPVAVKQLR